MKQRVVVLAPPAPLLSVRWLIVLALVGIGYAVGNYHFITGSEVGFKVIRKVSFNLSETWVNMDELGNMPAIMARGKYPMMMKALADKAVATGAEQDLGPQVVATLRAGMSRSEVQAILGPPSDPNTLTLFGSTRESWHYRSALQGRFVSLEFRDGRLTDIRD